MEEFAEFIKSTRESLNELSEEIQRLKSNYYPFGESIPSSPNDDISTSSADSSFTDIGNRSSPVISLSVSRKSTRLLASSTNGLTPLEKKEATVLAKVAELQKRGIWNRIPDKLPPAREKTHWDFVLEEMGWIYEAYRRDSQNSNKNAKKCKNMIQKYFADKEMAKLRAERAQEQNLRKIASSLAKDVKTFWGNIEKLFEFRLRSQLDKKRRQALDEHLNFLVDKSEKFTSMIAESFTETNSLKTTPTPSDSEMGAGGQDDDDYEPDQNSDDDERTIAKDDNHDADEIDKLKEESDIPVEELLKQYYPELYQPKSKSADKLESNPDPSLTFNGDSVSSASDSVDSDSDDSTDENDGSDNEEDDEENENFEMNGDDADSDEPVTKKQRIEDTKSCAEDSLLTENQTEDESADEDEENGLSLKALMTDGEGKFSDVIEMAAKFQPTGNTLDTTNVITKVPFLLRGTLREYQHIGLDWMVSLYERKLNGILADEMGLGKTIQTISLLCHLACEKQIWGPHLIVVPTSVMLNWEMELKKWAPGFKVLTYYGSQKERRMKRVGWTKPHTFHVCITSYKLVIQDHQCFRRKRWQYLILDEAQHIKNFKSQRWQLLLNFASEGRLLLTGTPLQNNLMELWSLMHFLMPNIFESHRDFQEWFSNPLTGMVEGSAEYNEGLIQRLHKVLRPFLLRRLKNEVEKQLPKKFEHIIKCPLSKRQRYLYDDFMCRAKTKETLESGNLLSVINVLMQLRKVCNHPNLFEPRPTVVPFVADSADISFPKLVTRALQHDHLEMIDFSHHPLVFTMQEFFKTAYVTYRLEKKRVPLSVIHNGVVNNLWTRKINVPRKVIRMSRALETSGVKKAKLRLPFDTVCKARLFDKRKLPVTVRIDDHVFTLVPRKLNNSVETEDTSDSQGSPKKRLTDAFTINDINSKEKNDIRKSEIKRKIERQHQKGIFSSSIFRKTTGHPSPRKVFVNGSILPLVPDPGVSSKIHENKVAKAQVIFNSNYRKCSCIPLYGQDFVNSCTIVNHQRVYKLKDTSILKNNKTNSKTLYSMSSLVASLDQLVDRVDEFTRKFHMFVKPCVVVQTNTLCQASLDESFETVASNEVTAWTHRLNTQHLLQLPETRLIQYDCGKLQVLGRLLHRLKAEGHRVLIFTQMAKVLDILESFMNFQGHTYLRLDGSTKVEMRQILTERFNMNNKYFCFILSTRSGGVGINLTGADTVIFYDSDWNPTMDAQAQDRCHRIGQTRDVHIYRLVSERTIEENILKKANQKRLLGDLAIEGGNFTTAHFQKSTIKDLFEVEESSTETSQTETVYLIEDPSNQVPDRIDEKTKKRNKLFESALTAAEENTDVEALKLANQEAAADEAEFNDEEGDNFGSLLKQLTPIEKFALAQMEFHEGDWKRDQLALADAALEAQRKELDARKQEDHHLKSAMRW